MRWDFTKSRWSRTAVQPANPAGSTLVHGYHQVLMFGGRSFRLARVFGIPIAVHWSWFLVLFLMIYSLTGYFQEVITGSEDSGAFVLATASALLFFLSIVLHELGHALVAMRNG